jgi:hypothetical protein
MIPFDAFISSLVIVGILFLVIFDVLLYVFFKARLAHSRRNIFFILITTFFFTFAGLLYVRENDIGEVVRGWPLAYYIGDEIDYIKLIFGIIFYFLFVLDTFTIVKILRKKVFKKLK